MDFMDYVTEKKRIFPQRKSHFKWEEIKKEQ